MHWVGKYLIRSFVNVRIPVQDELSSEIIFGLVDNTKVAFIHNVHIM